MLDPSMRRFVSDRHDCVHFPEPVSFAIAALYFSSADLCFTGSFSSQRFSSKSLPPKSASASLMWHLIAAATSLPSSEPVVSAHLTRSLLSAAVVSTVPASSLLPASIDVEPSQYTRPACASSDSGFVLLANSVDFWTTASV